tara:strand:+ start:213 stop:713 length:501 start_codon:yes stop_codon:yes gene_type:complete
MRDQEIVGLYEAYNSIYSNVNEEVEQLNENAVSDAVGSFLKKGGEVLKQKTPGVAAALTTGGGRKTPTATSGGYRPVAKEEVETDLFDYILEYLVAEGYADTNEAAVTIMANMSEEWRESIVEKSDDTYLEPNLKKRKKNNEKAIKDMKDNPNHKEYVDTVRKKFD